jgi:hypothetical protein
VRPRPLLVALLALTLSANAHAEGNRTLTCSVSPAVAGCLVEQPVFVLGHFEVAVGIDAQLAYGHGRTGHLAPYLLAGWYAPTWSAWFEFHLPQTGIPTLGRPDPWRLGVTWRF